MEKHKRAGAVRVAMIHNIAQGVPAFTSNAFLVVGERNVLIDAGNDFDAISRVQDSIDILDAIVLTHTHPDHIGNVSTLKSEFDPTIWGYDSSHGLIEHTIADQEVVKFGNHEYKALYTPGHAPDHLCFYSSGSGVLFAGDLIFANGGFGRTDLPGSDRSTLIESIDYVLETVDDSFSAMYTGHGPAIDTDPLTDIELARRAAQIG